MREIEPTASVAHEAAENHHAVVHVTDDGVPHRASRKAEAARPGPGVRSEVPLVMPRQLDADDASEKPVSGGRRSTHNACSSAAATRATTLRAAMTDLHFGNLLIVVALAFFVPFALGFVPSLRLPAVVLEIVAGIVVGPSVLGWVTIDEPLSVLALIGLAFLLFLAGLEIDIHELRGRPLRLAALGFVFSFAHCPRGRIRAARRRPRR